LLLLLVAGRSLRDRANPRRLATASFWGLLAIGFLAGERLPLAVVGLGVVAIALLAGLGGLRQGGDCATSSAQRHAEAARLGHRLFIPALLIPGITLLLAVPFKDLRLADRPLLDTVQTTLIALAVACVFATVTACVLTRERPARAVEETR